MQFVSVNGGKLQVQQSHPGDQQLDVFTLGLKALDALLPPNGLSMSAVHEVLGNGCQWSFAMLLAHRHLTMMMACRFHSRIKAKCIG